MKIKRSVITEKVYRVRWGAGNADSKTKGEAEAKAALIELILGEKPLVESFVRSKVFYTEKKSQ